MRDRQLPDRISHALREKLSRDPNIRLRNVSSRGEDPLNFAIYFEVPGRAPCVFGYRTGSLKALISTSQIVDPDEILDFVVLIVCESLIDEVTAVDRKLPPCGPEQVTWINRPSRQP